MITLPRLVTGALVFFAGAATTLADSITIGISDGIIITRDEFNLTAGLGASYEANFGVGEPIVSVDYTVGNEVAIGRGNGNISSRNIDVMNLSDNTSAILGGSITSAAVRPDGHVAFGSAAGAVFMQDRTNYGAAAPGYTGSFNGVPIFATPISGIGVFPNGDLAIGGQNGTIWVRDQNDVAATSSLLVGSEPIFALALNDLEVTPNGNIIMAFNNGLLVSRDPGDIANNLSIVDFGAAEAPTALAVFPNGNIVVGTTDGGVSIRNEFDVITVIGPSTPNFTSPGIDITALTVTAGGNVVIGSADGQVFVQDGSDLASGLPGGYANFGGAVVINDLAAYAAIPPEFESITVGAAPDTVVIQWSNQVDRVYTVREFTNLVTGTFTDLTNGIPSAGASTVYTANAPHASATLQVISDPAP